jgi:alpha-beta hydrolase superfamily lysophospholipase
MAELKIDEKTAVTYGQWNAPLPKAVLLLVHGLGAHSQRWNFLADFFLQHNISSYAIELRGFGETKGLKGDVENFNIYYNDIRSLCGIIRRENPNKKIFLIGESMGALISFLAAVEEPDLFSGIVLLSPVFKSRLRMPSLSYFKIFFSLFYEPKKQFHIPFDSKMCTRDAAYQKIMDSDSREHRLTTARLLLNIVLSQIRAQYLKNRIRAPILFLLSGKDELADTRASQSFFQSLKTEDKGVFLYPEMRHALSIELGREKVFGDILEWIKIRI